MKISKKNTYDFARAFDMQDSNAMVFARAVFRKIRPIDKISKIASYITGKRNYNRNFQI